LRKPAVLIEDCVAGQSELEADNIWLDRLTGYRRAEIQPLASERDFCAIVDPHGNAGALQAQSL